MDAKILCIILLVTTSDLSSGRFIKFTSMDVLVRTWVPIKVQSNIRFAFLTVFHSNLRTRKFDSNSSSFNF